MQVKYLDEAELDLAYIDDYCIENFGLAVANEVQEYILTTIDNLAIFPDIGIPINEPGLAEMGFCILILKKQVAIHKRVNDVIFIYRILDIQRNYVEIFKQYFLP